MIKKAVVLLSVFIAASLLLIPPSAWGASVFSSGFETGNFSEWDVRYGAVAIVSDVKYSGSYGLRASFSAAWQDVWVSKGGLKANPVYLRFYARFNKLPAEGHRFNLAQIYDASYNAIGGIRITTENGKTNVRLSRYRPAAVGTNYQYDFAINTWYCFELKFFNSASGGEYRVYVNGQQVIVDGGLDTSGSVFKSIKVGHSSDDTGSGLITWFDDVVVADTYVGPVTPTATIHGVVTDSASANPIQDVMVSLDGGTSALTGSDGSYSFATSLGSHTLTFQKAGYTTQTRTQDCPTQGDYVLNVSLVKVPTAIIKGNVTDAATAAPIAAANATVSGVASVLTATNGSYSFVVNLGSYTLTFSKAGYATQTKNQDCPAEGTYVVDAALAPRLAIITGTVTDQSTGAVLLGVKVTAGTSVSYTNASGVYVLTVRLGSYTLTFEKSGYYLKTTSVNCSAEDTYVVNMALVPVPPASVIFTSGYETGDYSEWSGTGTDGAASLAIVSDVTHHGSYSSRATFTGAWQGAYSGKYGLSANPVYIRWYSRFDRLPANGEAFTMIESIDAGWNTIWDMDIERSSTGTVRLFFYATRPGIASHYYDYPFQPNTWYCFEVKFFNDASGGEYRVYLNGVEVITLTNLNTSGSSWMGMRLGKGSGWMSSLTTWTDCVQVATAYIGPELSGQASIADIPQSNDLAGSPLMYWNLLADANQKTTLNSAKLITGNSLVDLAQFTLTSWQAFIQVALGLLLICGFSRVLSRRRRPKTLLSRSASASALVYH